MLVGTESDPSSPTVRSDYRALAAAVGPPRALGLKHVESLIPDLVIELKFKPSLVHLHKEAHKMNYRREIDI